MLSAFRALPTWSRCTTCAKVHRLFLSFARIVCGDQVNSARNADHAVRTCEKFVYSIVKITRLNDYHTSRPTHFEEIYAVRKGMWVFISWLCFADADWLSRQTPVTWFVCSSNCAKLPPESVFCLVFNVFYFNGHWIRDNWATCILVNDTWTEQSPVEVDGTSTKLKQIPHLFHPNPGQKFQLSPVPEPALLYLELQRQILFTRYQCNLKY